MSVTSEFQGPACSCRIFRAIDLKIEIPRGLPSKKISFHFYGDPTSFHIDSVTQSSRGSVIFQISTKKLSSKSESGLPFSMKPVVTTPSVECRSHIQIDLTLFLEGFRRNPSGFGVFSEGIFFS